MIFWSLYCFGLSPRGEGPKLSEWVVCLGHRPEALTPAAAIRSLPLLQHCHLLGSLSNHYPWGVGLDCHGGIGACGSPPGVSCTAFLPSAAFALCPPFPSRLRGALGHSGRGFGAPRHLQHSTLPLLPAGFEQILLLSKLCPSPRCPDPQLSSKVLAVADKSFCRGQLLKGPARASKG